MDQEAFLVGEYPRLLGTLGLYVGDEALAEELVQEALAQALVAWDRVEAASSPGAYLHRIAMNIANSYFRRRRVAARARRRMGAEVSHRDPDVAAVVSVQEAIAGLPRRQRQIILLRYQSDLTLQETADVLGMTIGAVKSLSHRATKTLRELLSSDEESAHVR